MLEFRLTLRRVTTSISRRPSNHPTPFELLHRTLSSSIWSVPSATEVSKSDCQLICCRSLGSFAQDEIGFLVSNWIGRESAMYVSQTQVSHKDKIALCHLVSPQCLQARPWYHQTKGITAKLELKPNAQQKFRRAWPVPYALQEAVEAEYHRLESKGDV